MTIAAINSLAEQYALQYNPDNIVPFPYENILEDHPNLEIHFLDLEDNAISGATLYKDEIFTILVNTTKPQTRQHFSLGHELGHYFLHKELLQQTKGILDDDTAMDGPNILYRADDAPSTQLEREANNFAASLIMPTHLVRDAWEATHRIEECARIFKVSVVAMSVRLTRLGLTQ
jgi:Zn-dependent peptidase ImmA (M78 family)